MEEWLSRGAQAESGDRATLMTPRRGPGHVLNLRSRPRARGQSPSGIRGFSRLYAALVVASPAMCLAIRLEAAGSGVGGHP